MCIGLQFPDMVDNLSALYQSMDSRTRLVDRLSKLKGKLELMLSQVLPSFQNKYFDFYISVIARAGGRERCYGSSLSILAQNLLMYILLYFISF